MIFELYGPPGTGKTSLCKLPHVSFLERSQLLRQSSGTKTFHPASESLPQFPTSGDQRTFPLFKVVLRERKTSDEAFPTNSRIGGGPGHACIRAHWYLTVYKYLHVLKILRIIRGYWGSS